MRPADWTRLIDWVVEFRALHEEARTGKLDRQRREKYDQESESLVRALLVAQRLSVKPGQTARQSLRVARELPVELTLGGQAQKVKTIDLGLGGFAAMLGKPPRVDERVA